MQGIMYRRTASANCPPQALFWLLRTYLGTGLQDVKSANLIHISRIVFSSRRLVFDDMPYTKHQLWATNKPEQASGVCLLSPFPTDMQPCSCYLTQVLACPHALMNTIEAFFSSGCANAQLPGYFHPWTLSLDIGLNMFPLDSFMSCLHSLLEYFTGEFRVLQLIVLAAFGEAD